MSVGDLEQRKSISDISGYGIKTIKKSNPIVKSKPVKVDARASMIELENLQKKHNQVENKAT